MSTFGSRYVIDTNALGHIKRHRRASDFFKEYAVIPSQVLVEARGFPDHNDLRKNEYSTNIRILELLGRVLATVPIEDTSLLDLYSNKGGADPFVIACALHGQEADSRYLGAHEWIVVSADSAVQEKAKEFGLAAIDGERFAEIIDNP